MTREAPYLYADAPGTGASSCPSVQTNSSGTSWAQRADARHVGPDRAVLRGEAADSAATINAALRSGQNLLLTPGVYHLDQSINVTRPDTVVLGLGFPTLIPTTGDAAMTTSPA